MKKMITLLLLLSLSLPLLAATKVEIKTSLGDMQLELDADKAPKTVENFLAYVNEGYYDGTVFHRVISGFMIQGGGFEYKDDKLVKKTTRDGIENEAKNGLKNVRGSIAMARTRAPHSATSQFFINHANNANLDYPSFDGWGYAVFGAVTQGLEVLDKIAALKTGTVGGMQNVPSDEVKIISIRVIE